MRILTMWINFCKHLGEYNIFLFKQIDKDHKFFTVKTKYFSTSEKGLLEKSFKTFTRMNVQSKTYNENHNIKTQKIVMIAFDQINNKYYKSEMIESIQMVILHSILLFLYLVI